MSAVDRDMVTAAWWHARQTDGAGEADRAGCEAWQAANNDRRRAYADVSRVAEAIDRAACDPRLQAMADAALARAHPRRVRWHRPALALTAIVGAPLAAFTLHYAQRPTTPAPMEVATAIGQRRQVALPGGGALLLDSGSRAVIRQQDERPSVEIVGQGYISGRDAAAPLLTVRAGPLTILPNGSELNVRNIAGQQDVLVRVGDAEVDQGDVRGRLTSGQSLHAGAGRATIRPVADPELVLGWRRGWLHFDDATLVSAIAEMNRYRHAPLRLHDARVARMRISGSFRIADSDGFATMLKAALPVRTRTLPDGTTDIVAK